MNDKPLTETAVKLEYVPAKPSIYFRYTESWMAEYVAVSLTTPPIMCRWVGRWEGRSSEDEPWKPMRTSLVVELVRTAVKGFLEGVVTGIAEDDEIGAWGTAIRDNLVTFQTAEKIIAVTRLMRGILRPER